ncbi:MAG: nucleoside hydrolase [Lachnospiraceae bacterium]
MFQFSFNSEMMHDVVITFDTESQSDDQFALVYALLSPRLNIRGIVVTHCGETCTKDTTISDGIQIASKILHILHREDVPVIPGSKVAFSEDKQQPISQGASFIVQCARERKLTILCMTVLTDLAMAIRSNPEITSQLRIIWAGGGAYPMGADYEPNIMNDRLGANYVLQSGCNFWQVPKNIYRRFNVSFAELQLKVLPMGELGAYLYQLIMKRAYNPKRPLRCGCYWVLGNLSIVGLMLCDYVYCHEDIPAPIFSNHCIYMNAGTNNTIRVYNDIDHRFILEDFFAKLAIYHQSENN